MKNKIVMLSDIHIGDNSPTCWYQKSVHEQYLLTILKWIVENAENVSELVLAGDVVDTWTYPFNVQPPSFATIASKNPNVFGLQGGLARVLDALGGAVTYIPGNHDMSVTGADVASVKSPGGHNLRFSQKNYNPAGDSRILMTHGNDFTMFNAPDLATKWAPLPVGHFVTRTIATYWQSNLPAGKNVSELKDQGYPNGIDALSIILNALKNFDVSISAALIDGIAGKEGVSESWPILLANGSITTLTEVKAVYNDIFTRWVAESGGGKDGLLVAVKAALADYDASYMGWFAQRQAFRSNAQVVVMGHTHAPISGLSGSLVSYINSGFECPSTADMPKKAISFTVVNKDSLTTEIKQVILQADGSFAIVACPAPTTSIVITPFMDFSCYVLIDNSQNNQNLTLARCDVGHGHFINLPQHIAARSQATLWLQDYPDSTPLPHGSDAVVVYRADDGTNYVFCFDCPTGIYPNSCSGGSSFQAKAGDGGWLPPGQVPKTGHPLFVNFKVIPGVVGGSFKGKCGQNSSAVSVAGLQPTESVVLNGKSDLSSCMIANDNGAVFGIRLDKGSGIYEYQLSVDAQGPKGAGSGYMYLYFTDESGDRYLLKIFVHTRKTHTLKYNSKAPAIMMIEWNNKAIH
ncbi:MAG: metallophosphoesterase [Methanothrix sp.]